MKNNNCFVVDFCDDNTQVFIEGNEVNVSQLFDEANIDDVDKKMLIKITSGSDYLYDGYELVVEEPFVLPEVIKNEQILQITNFKRDEIYRKVIINTKVNLVDYNEAVNIYKGLEEKGQFSDYCDVICGLFYFCRNKERGR